MFKFQNNDIESMQKRLTEKEQRRLQERIPRVQQTSRNLQQTLSQPDDDSQSSQFCDTPIFNQTQSVGTEYSLGEPFSAGTTLNTVNFCELPVATTAKSFTEDGENFSSPPRLRDRCTEDEAANSDPWLHTLFNQVEPFAMLEWPLPDIATADLAPGDVNDGPEPTPRTPSVYGGIADGLGAPTDPTQFSGTPDRGVSDMESLFYENILVPHEEPLETIRTPSLTPAYESEASTIVHEAPSAAKSRELGNVEVLIRALPPQDEGAYKAVSDCSSSPSDCESLASNRSHEMGGRKKPPRANSVGASEDSSIDDYESLDDGLRRSKRHCHGAKDNHHQSFSGACHTATNTSATPITIQDTSQHSLVIREDKNHATSIPGKHEISATAASSPSALPADKRQHLVPTIRPRNRDDANTLPAKIHMGFGQDCTSCGINRTRLLELSQAILRSADFPDNTSLETLLLNGASLSAHDTRAVLLRLDLCALRDYILDPIPRHNIASSATEQSYDSQDSVDPGKRADKSSDEAEITQCFDPSPITEDSSVSDPKSDNEMRLDSNMRRLRQKKRGRRGRWSKLDEGRLRSFVLEGLSWSQIGQKLNRSTQAVMQHWRIMSQK